MNLDILKESLQSLQISDTGIEIYCLLIQKSDQSITRLGESLKLHRASIYQALEELQNIGLIASYKGGKIELNPISKVQTLVQDKETELSFLSTKLEKFTEHLKNFKSASGDMVEIYRGQNGFRAMMNYVISRDITEKFYLGSAERFWDVVGWEYNHAWIEKRVGKNIKSKTIVFPNHYYNDLSKKHTNQLRTVKYLPKKYEREGSFVAYGNELICFDPVEPVAILIKNVVISELFKMLFDLIWEQLD